MAEYIDREALRAKAVYMHGFGENKYVPLKAIENAPAADVETVKHGRWKNIKIAVVDTVGDCTNCGREAVWRSRNKPYFVCPNCGAKMDLEVQ